MTRKSSAKRRRWAVAALSAASVAAFLWTWTKTAVDAPDEAANEQGAELTADQQTPPTVESQPKVETAASEEVPLPTPESDDNPYQFENWEDMADTLAEMMGKEFDIMRKERGSEIPDIRIALDAYIKVFESIFDKNENPQLRDAVEPFLPFSDDSPYDKNDVAIPEREYDPYRFLVRAGRLSPLVLKSKLTLPNGEIYYSDEMEDVIMVWQRERPPGNRKALERFEKSLADLEKKLAQTPDNKLMQQKAVDLRAAIEELKKPGLTHFEAYSFSGDPTHPDHKITFLDLGVLK